jgi:hypothetical protein
MIQRRYNITSLTLPRVSSGTRMPMNRTPASPYTPQEFVEPVVVRAALRPDPDVADPVFEFIGKILGWLTLSAAVSLVLVQAVRAVLHHAH